MLLSDALRHSAWDIRSGNRSVVHDEVGFLAKAREMSVQSTRSILRMRSDPAPIFTKKRFYLCCVCVSLDQATRLFLLPCASRTCFAVDEACGGYLRYPFAK